MKKLIYIILASLTLTTGCNKNFDELSQNPNGVKEGSAATLVSQTVYNALVSRLRVSKAVGNELMGYTVQKSERAYTQRFDLRSNLGDDLWNRHYTVLNNVEDMRKRAIAEGNANYEGVALTLKAWIVSELTDTFRDVPYFEATKGDELKFLPAYDTQEDIYKDLMENLDRASLLFDNTKAMVASGDILFGNKGTNSLQVTAWRKFCNSLRLRLYLRVSNSPEFDSATKINEIVSNPAVYPVFTSAADQAYVAFTNELPLYNPYYNATNGGFGAGAAPSTTILDMLQESSDPRLSIYYTRSVPVWTGIRSGFPLGAGADIYLQGSSYMNYTLHNSPRLGMIMSYDEVQFILAEAAFRGWINVGTTAATYYQNAVRTNCEFWGLTPSSTFLNGPEVAYNNTLERIIKQKYISSFFRGLEAWFDYRRTGYPNLTIDPRADNGAIVPSRLPYPMVTQRYNPTNYRKAVERLGGDKITIKAFWEKP